MTPALDEGCIMMPVKLQGHRLSDPIRIFWFRCKWYRLNQTDPKSVLEKIDF